MALDMTLLQKTLDFLDSEEGQKSTAEYCKKLKLADIHKERWIERIYARIKDNSDKAIERVIEWYDSDKYRDRKRKLGLEPREELYWSLYDIAKKYGRELTDLEYDKYENIFTGGIYILGSYVIQIMNGQGSCVSIDKIQ
jgi:hypothetical protein